MPLTLAAQQLTHVLESVTGDMRFVFECVCGVGGDVQWAVARALCINTPVCAAI